MTLRVAGREGGEPGGQGQVLLIPGNPVLQSPNMTTQSDVGNKDVISSAADFLVL